jgi:hypothetical protein
MQTIFWCVTDKICQELIYSDIAVLSNGQPLHEEGEEVKIYRTKEAKLNLVTHICNPSTLEAEVRAFQSSLGYNREPR